jgi:hypothetical protein
VLVFASEGEAAGSLRYFENAGRVAVAVIEVDLITRDVDITRGVLYYGCATALDEQPRG